MNAKTVQLILQLLQVLFQIGPEAADAVIKLRQLLSLSPDFAANVAQLTSDDIQADEATITAVNQWLADNGIAVPADGGPAVVPKV
ncbi:MAG TPA: hypothetical protein VJN64_11735 [Terriglobales bacterium]|nr:hypothetical protein [Terriglobales bacterium]